MALVSTSVQVSSQDATPIVKIMPREKGARVRTASGFILAANFTGGTTAQWYTFVRVPARARVLGVFMSNATSTTGAVKFGLYRPNGIAISDAVFQAVVATTAQNRARVDSALTAAQRRDPLSTAFATAVGTAGATNDVEYDIAAAIVTVIGTPVDALVEVDYVLDE